MDDSLPRAGVRLDSHSLPQVEPAAWKGIVSHVCAFLMSILFLVAGLWKITDAPGAAVRLAQAKVPQELSLAAAILLGIAETVAAVWILMPRFRRWGSLLMSVLLVAFLIYIGIYYDQLRGEECNCFPWIKRAVGPGFFIGDVIMLAMAALAGWWVRPSHGVRAAVLTAAAVTVFAVVSYGVVVTHQKGVQAPETIMVDGKPFSLQEGRVVIYFFDPECSHCLDAGRRMAKMDWGETRLVVVPTTQPQFAQGFLQATGLKAVVSLDLEPLKKVFPFVSAPAGVAIENGRQKAALSQFEGSEPEDTLRKLNFLQ